MLTWVDEHVQPAASLLAQPTTSSAESVKEDGGESPKSTDGPSRPTGMSTGASAGPAGSMDSRTMTADEARASGERQGTMSLAEPEGERAGVPR